MNFHRKNPILAPSKVRHFHLILQTHLILNHGFEDPHLFNVVRPLSDRCQTADVRGRVRGAMT